MPGLNGTGPQGYGPGTGRGMGPCAGGAGFNQKPIGRGQGFGSRFCRWFGFRNQQATPENELENLEQQAQLLEQNLEIIQKRIKDLKK